MRRSDGAVVRARRTAALSVLLFGLAALQIGAGTVPRDLLNAASASDLARVKALIAAKADVAASDRDGLTPLIAATQAKDKAIVRELLLAGAPPDARHRHLGTALDVAERQGQTEIAALLRRHGARGSGKSVGDTVCVRMWQGDGYCGTVTAIEWPYWTLNVTRVLGCEQGCPPRRCSLWRPVGGSDAKGISIGDAVRVEGSCLTHTGQPASGR